MLSGPPIVARAMAAAPMRLNRKTSELVYNNVYDSCQDDCYGDDDDCEMECEERIYPKKE